jgi:preprotein translocase SecE subunit
VSGETRRQRRDARRASGESAVPATPAPAPAGTPPATATVAREQRGGFVRESWAELKKVEWPNRAQVVQGTIVVIIACAVVGAYLWGLDQILRPFVRDILIG